MQSPVSLRSGLALQCLVCAVEQVSPAERPGLSRVGSGNLSVVVPEGAFQAGDYFVHLPPGTQLTPWLMKHFRAQAGDELNACLVGDQVVGSRGLGGLPSQGLAYTVKTAQSSFGELMGDPLERYHHILVDPAVMRVRGFVVELNDDVTDLLRVHFSPNH